MTLGTKRGALRDLESLAHRVRDIFAANFVQFPAVVSVTALLVAFRPVAFFRFYLRRSAPPRLAQRRGILRSLLPRHGRCVRPLALLITAASVFTGGLGLSMALFPIIQSRVSKLPASASSAPGAMTVELRITGIDAVDGILFSIGVFAFMF